MKNLILLAALSACLLLGGCVSLLERSYSVVEPYADRYWDSAAEDTLKAENYQDLVNSLLMQVEQRAEECVIRGYGEAAGYGQARSASWEVRRETIPGSYLLENMTFDYEPSDGYSTFTFRMSYREDAEDIEAMMSLSDSQSLVDLLRLSVREERDKLTARFSYDTPREDVIRPGGPPPAHRPLHPGYAPGGGPRRRGGPLAGALPGGEGGRTRAAAGGRRAAPGACRWRRILRPGDAALQRSAGGGARPV